MQTKFSMVTGGQTIYAHGTSLMCPIGYILLGSRCYGCETSGYILASNIRCYNISTDRMTWGNARLSCENDGAVFASFKPEEQEAVTNLL